MKSQLQHERWNMKQVAQTGSRCSIPGNFKVTLNRALSKLNYWKMSLCIAWVTWPLKVPNHCTSLWTRRWRQITLKAASLQWLCELFLWPLGCSQSEGWQSPVQSRQPRSAAACRSILASLSTKPHSQKQPQHSRWKLQQKAQKLQTFEYCSNFGRKSPPLTLVGTLENLVSHLALYVWWAQGLHKLINTVLINYILKLSASETCMPVDKSQFRMPVTSHRTGSILTNPWVIIYYLSSALRPHGTTHDASMKFHFTAFGGFFRSKMANCSY